MSWGGGSANSLTQPTPAHADETSANFRLNPSSGPAAGGTNVTITPSSISGIKFTTISSGYSHTLALGDDGNAYAWGQNVHGQIGDNTVTTRLTPTRVITPANIKFTQISAGSVDHSTALGTDGYIYTWGWNDRGRLGLGDTTDRIVPTKIPLPAGVNRFLQIKASNRFVIALGDNGKVYAWGMNRSGQLGVGTSTTAQHQHWLLAFPIRLISSASAQEHNSAYH
ncbi:RCC1 domain-containing protein [Bombiscardovia apis]|uniref:RCC1 domain-containing protein n=1 Tax=Bombiscardovia apis TaxID=2932182 RepID=UPI003CE47E75